MKEKEQGIQKAAESAGAEWLELAYQKSILFFNSGQSNGYFTIEDIRKWIDVFLPILPEPPSNRAWGTIARRLVKEKKIIRRGLFKHETDPHMERLRTST